MKPLRNLLIVFFSVLLLSGFAGAKDVKSESKVFRIGIIGTTTSHVPAALGLFNAENPKYKNPESAKYFKGFRITAAYKGGMPDNESAWSRRDVYAKNCEEAGVKIYSTIEEMLPHVDGILLESVDGRPHLEQAIPVINAKIPLFIDKPMAGSLADAVKIFRLAKENGVPVFSGSSLRYSLFCQKMRNEKPLGTIYGCEAFSPASLNPKHPDLYWYGIHGVETLFTIMGPECISVSRTKTDSEDLAVGIWKEGRIGTFRGLRDGRKGYGARVFCEKGITEGGDYEGYEPMFVEICKFFRTGKTPFSNEETIRILAFMSAADESWQQGGKHILLDDVLEKANFEIRKNIDLVMQKDGDLQWNGESADLAKVSKMIDDLNRKGVVVRIILNNRAGASFELVQKVLEAVDHAYLANYLY
ncbi:MAG: Gfo/Idh/MocA family oxidoreductase [Planctomycetia bacterium]|nr:Gfo/Idh/MocA family oxidoreductase [Planctomycetia bacterium]